MLFSTLLLWLEILAFGAMFKEHFFNLFLVSLFR